MILKTNEELKRIIERKKARNAALEKIKSIVFAPFYALEKLHYRISYRIAHTGWDNRRAQATLENMVQKYLEPSELGIPGIWFTNDYHQFEKMMVNSNPKIITPWIKYHIWDLRKYLLQRFEIEGYKKEIDEDDEYGVQIYFYKHNLSTDR